MSLRTELAVRTESFMGIGDEQGSKQLKLAPKILKGYICNPYGLEGYSTAPTIYRLFCIWGFPGVVYRYGHPGTYLDIPRNEVEVEVQPETSRWVVGVGCWTLCYRFANPNPVTLTLHRVRVRVNPNPGLLKWLVAYGSKVLYNCLLCSSSSCFRSAASFVLPRAAFSSFAPR